MAKSVIWQIQLDSSQFKEGLKGVSGGVKEIQKLLGKPLTIEIDAKQFDKLIGVIRGKFDQLRKDMAYSMSQGSQNVASAVKSMEKSLGNLAPVAAQVGKQAGQAIAAGLAAGGAQGAQMILQQVREVNTRVAQQAVNQAKELIARFQQLQAGAQGQFFQNLQQSGRSFFEDPDKLASELISRTAGKKGKQGSLFVDPEATGDIKRAISQAEEYQRTLDNVYTEVGKASINAAETAQKADEKAFNESQRLAGEKLRLMRAMQNELTGEEARANAERIANEKRRIADEVAANKAQEKAIEMQQKELVDNERRAVADKIAEAKAYYKYQQTLTKEADSVQASELRDQTEREKAYYRYKQQLMSDDQRAQVKYIRMSGAADRAGVNLSDIGLSNPNQFLNKNGNFDNVAAAKYSEAFKTASQHASELDKNTHGVFGNISQTENGLVRTVALMAKWLVFIRLVRDVEMAIERTIGAIVSGGIEYLQTQELQKLALTATLNEHAKITDSQGNQLKGMVSLDALSGAVNDQWKKLQQMSLAVVGSTQDLMDIYVSLLPVVGRLHGSLDDAMGLTKSTAIAAGVMGISFSDARTAIMSLLRGNFLGKNRLVAALGISKEDIAELKGTPALLAKVQDSLKSFAMLGDKAQLSFGALRETFTEIVNRVGGELVTPFTNAFRSMVVSMQGSIFDKDFQPSPKTQLFFEVLKSAMSDVVDQMKEFGGEMTADGDKKITTFAVAIKNAVEAVTSLVTWLAKAALNMAEFVAAHEKMLKVLAYSVGIATLGRMFYDLSGKIVLAGEALGMFATKLPTGPVDIFAKATSNAKEWFVALGARIATGLAVGAAVSALSILINKMFEFQQAAEDAATAQAKVIRGDVFGAIAAENTNLNSKDVEVSGQAHRVFGASVDKTLDKLNTVTNGEDAVAAAKAIADKRIAIDKELTDKTKALTQERLQSLLLEKDALEGKSEAINRYLQDLQTLGGSEDQLREKAKALRSEPDGPTTIMQGDMPVDITALVNQSHKDREKLAAALEADADKIKQAREKARLAMLGIEHNNAKVQLLDKPSDTPLKDKDLSFDNNLEPVLQRQMRLFQQKQQVLDAFRQNDLISESAYIKQSDENEDSQYNTEVDLLGQMKALWLDHEAELRKHHKSEGDIQKEKLQFDTQIAQRELEAADNQNTKTAIRTARDAGGTKRLDAQKVETQSDIDKFFAGIFGNTEAKIGDEVDIMIDQIKKKFKDNPSEAQPLIQQLLLGKDKAVLFKAVEDQVVGIDRNLSALSALESKYNDQLDNGSVSMATYSKNIAAVEAAEEGLLKVKIEKIKLLIKEANARNADADPSNNTPQSKIDELSASLANAETQLDKLTSKMVKANKAFEALKGLIDSINKIGSAIGEMKDGFGEVIGQITGAATAMFGFLDSIKSAISEVSKLTSAAKGSGMASFFAQFSGMSATKTVTDAEGNVTTAVSKASVALGAVTFGASAAIAIGIAMYKHAVEEIKKTLTTDIDSISKALANGSLTIAEAQADLIAAKNRAIAQYSSSKAGRNVLKDILPDIDKQLDDLANKIKEMRQSFADKLQDVKLGNGPFADFARMLFDLQKETKDYLSTFTVGTKEYADALRQVSELWKQTLLNAKANLQAQMMDFNTEAINSAEQVFDLMDQKSQMFDQLADIEDRFASLRDQEEQDAKDKEKEWNQIIKDREDNTKKILDLQKQIADVVRKAAEDEDTIRRRGILEAQQTIAQQKATDINKVRNDAQDQIDKLREQMQELITGDGSDPVGDFNKKWADRTKEMAKETLQLQKQKSQLQDQMALNEVKLRVAREIAAIEGQVFDLSGSRLDLETRRGEIEIEQAKTKVKQWKDTAALIDSIIEAGDGVLFNPPPGFPQINVQIGDININTTNNTTSDGGSGSGGGTDPGRPGTPTGPNTPPDDPGGRTPPGRGGGGGGKGRPPSSYIDFERRYPL